MDGPTRKERISVLNIQRSDIMAKKLKTKDNLEETKKNLEQAKARIKHMKKLIAELTRACHYCDKDKTVKPTDTLSPEDPLNPGGWD